jgi:hypothetical protein
MNSSVTTGTEGNQVALGIVSQQAPRVHMVHLEISWASAALAPPPISFEHLLVESLVGLKIEP